MICSGVLRAFRLRKPASWTQQRMQVTASSGRHVAANSRTLPSVSSSENATRGRFPVDERMEDNIMQVRNMIISANFIVTLNTATPITHSLMEEALNILYDKVPSLRLCYRLRGDQLWLTDMPERRLDFTSINGCDRQKEYDALMKSPFDTHNGPLWKARLMTCPENAPCYFPDVKAKFPHQYDLMISLYHAANDGLMAMVITNTLLSIIDNLLQGLPLDPKEVGVVLDGIETREVENRMRAAFLNDPPRLKSALQEYEKGKHVPLLVEAFGTRSDVANPRTIYFEPYFIDNAVMSRIVHKCRSMGITINSFVTATVNTGLVEMVRDAGLKRSNYSITGHFPVNLRRLMPRSSKPYLGFHNTPLHFNMDTPHDVKKNFWEYALKLDTEFRKQLKRNLMIEQWVLRVMTRPEGCTLEEYYSRPLPLCYDYFFTNFYSQKSIVQGTGKLAQITCLELETALHNRPLPLGLFLFGLRGQAILETGYSTVSLTEEVARMFSDKYLAILHDISSALT